MLTYGILFTNLFAAFDANVCRHSLAGEGADANI